MEVIANNSDNIEMEATVLSQLRNLITDIIYDNLPAFGVTRYVIMSQDAVPDYDHRYYGTFHEDDHPFRVPPEGFRRTDYSVFRRMNAQEPVSAIRDGLVVNVMGSFSLIIIKSDTEQMYFDKGMYPFVVQDGMPTIVPFPVVAVENCLTSDTFGLMQLMLPHFHVYVEPLNNGNPRPVVAKECRVNDPCQCRVRRQRRITRHIIDVLAEGCKWTFQDPDHFRKCLREREVNAGDIYIRGVGVPGRGHSGSTEVADFLAKELKLPKPLYRWKKRKLAYVQKRCGHRPREEGVNCELSSLSTQAQHQQLHSREEVDPVAISHGKP